jgi:hypothetical protein
MHVHLRGGSHETRERVNLRLESIVNSNDSTLVLKLAAGDGCELGEKSDG